MTAQSLHGALVSGHADTSAHINAQGDQTSQASDVQRWGRGAQLAIGKFTQRLTQALDCCEIVNEDMGQWGLGR